MEYVFAALMLHKLNQNIYVDGVKNVVRLPASLRTMSE
jgi:ribosomal protein L12E/L44/L45/RPP1/RPP2